MPDMADWLQAIGLERWTEVFLRNDIGLDVAADLTEADLRELGLSLGDRKRFLRAAAYLNKAPADEDGRAARRAHRPPARPAGRHEAGVDAERRQLTILFCDLVGSTALVDRFDPEEMFAIMSVYQRCCTEIVARFGGHVARFLGDGALAYFGFPAAREDDAERAVRAGLELTAAVAALRPRSDVRLAARVGIATGLVVIGDLAGSGGSDEDTVVGETPNLAARLQAIAPPHGVVISRNTRRLLGRMFALRALEAQLLKGFSGLVPSFEVLGESEAEGRFDARAGGGLTPLVGRDHELALILQRWEFARAGEGQVVIVAGEGGIGKSRLIHTLSNRIGEQAFTRLRYFCSQFYANTAFHPIVEQIRRAAHFSRDDTSAAKLDKLAALVADSGEVIERAVPLLATLCSIPLDGRYRALDLPPQDRKTQTIDLLLRQLDALARRRALMLVFEDVHWIDPTTSELVNQAIAQVRSLPVLMLITHRPEFQPPWRAAAHVSSLQLNRFGRAQSEDLITRLAGGKPLPEDARAVILEKADGIPLFVEELTRAILESGVLVDTGKRLELAGPLPQIAIPATLHDALMARLDPLGRAKEVALWAAAFGRSFTAEMLVAIVPIPAAEVHDALRRLVSARMVRSYGAPPNELFEFRHALVQDAAYSSMLRTRRQQVHARIARVLEERFDELRETQPELLEHHFREAGDLEKAFAYAVAAGDKAAGRYASPEAHLRYRSALEIARRLAPGVDADRAKMRAMIKMASVAASRPEMEGDLELLAEACRLAEAHANRPRLAQSLYWMGRLSYVLARLDEAVSFARRSLDASRGTGGSERLEAAGVNLLARIHCMRGEPEAIAYAARNRAQMAALGDCVEEAAISGVHAFALAAHGRFDEALAAAAEGVRLAEGLAHLPTRAAAHFFDGVVHGWRGDLAQAGPRFAAALQLAEAGGDPFRRYVAFGWRGEALLAAGEAEAAAADLERCLELAERIGAGFHLGAFMAFRALAALALGDQPGARAWSERALGTASSSAKMWARSIAQRARAETICADGHADEALVLIDQAIAAQAAHELRPDLAWSTLARGEVLAALGRIEDALQAIGEAQAAFAAMDMAPARTRAAARAEVLRRTGRRELRRP